ncbi:7-deoxyloganetin glucosyltransferase-like [Papaver somniferum]|uniref:7-deoxyloganetin glucosyltransferase-like n=1 Tax=Papaver somniferum TaxID=3469 RepID=UPI000E6FBCC8|nr:7-deoxyloganetin glucosyltransferase-like [Papaver somniferum]
MEKIHVVCIPYPVQSHISSMMKLAKILQFQITFVNTEFNHQRLLNARGPDAVKGLADFRFETISDGLPPPSNPNVSQDILTLCMSTKKNCLEFFRNLIHRLNNTTYSNVPPVSCIVSDGIMSFTLQAAKEFGIPVFLYWPVSFCAFVCILHFPNLIQRGLVPLKGESYLTNGYMENTLVDWIPGVKDIRFKDLPSPVRTTNPNDPMLDFITRETGRTHDAAALIFNTFDALEMEVLDALKSELPLPPVYTVGPLHLLLNQIPLSESQSLGSNLWKEDTECMKWLDSKEPKSVVYVNFGSITVMTPQQLVEFAWGLANSKHNFLWIIRPDLVDGESATLPPEFALEIKERGLLASWCPQEDVLNHASIAGFLTHCGWNSTLESLSCGVPMISWPFFAEQHTNCRYLCKHWEVSMEINSNVERSEVERLVRELMEGEKGKKMKKKAMEWKKKAVEATSPGGSSYVTIDKIVSKILASKITDQ